ncbi:MAG TPA: lysylphosphatidylglycerol synthase domain-containing protein, partial [Solirubrobacteraceae bacterium]|nr:lysylphosphatidylglycerol synthase domain-containing protein [Solirubrobacteraceae bacterium]
MFTRRSGMACALLAVPAAGLVLWAEPPGDVLVELGRIDPLWVTAAAALELASCASYVVAFRWLFQPVSHRSAGKLAWLGLGAAAVLPGGNVAGLATSCLLLHRRGVPTRRLMVRSSVLLLLINAVCVAGTAAAGALLLLGIAAGPHDVLRAGLPILVSGTLAALVAAVPWTVRSSGGRAPAPLASLADAATQAGHMLRRPDRRLIATAGYPLLDMAALWAAGAATGHPVSIAALVVAYNIGYLASIIPVPAGVGVLDGGLAAALIVYGASPAAAVAAVLVYHALALWIPALCGLVASARLAR